MAAGAGGGVASNHEWQVTMVPAPAASSLRVLYVNHVGVLGGAERSLLGLLQAVDRRQIEPHLAAPDDGPLADAARQAGIPVHPLPPCRLHRPQTPWDFVAAFRTFGRFRRALRRACRAVEPDLIHANSLISAWASTRVTRAPVVWHCRDLRAPAHLVRAVRRRATRVIAISQAVASYIEATAPQGAPVTVITNGFSPQDVHVTRRRSQVRGDWEMGAETPLIGCMGQLVPWKRQDVLLRAMPLVLEHVPQARVVFMGSDTFDEHPEYVASLHELANAPSLQGHVVWAGFVDHPADALAALDVLAHPADREPFGRVVLEALALGVPVVAVNQAGPAEIIEDGRSGLLVPPDDPAALAEGIVHLLQDGELREGLSDGARIRAGHFSVSHTAARVLELYREVLAP
ncbi:glycosyltransferase family 4 protein [bacterium]|nr:glycosyltransferase family 4 protein [bacterium]